MRIIDADSHLYEPRTLRADHTERARRDRALRIEDDALGCAWLSFEGQRIEALGAHQAG